MSTPPPCSSAPPRAVTRGPFPFLSDRSSMRILPWLPLRNRTRPRRCRSRVRFRSGRRARVLSACHLAACPTVRFCYRQYYAHMPCIRKCTLAVLLEIDYAWRGYDWYLSGSISVAIGHPSRAGGKDPSPASSSIHCGKGKPSFRSCHTFLDRVQDGLRAIEHTELVVNIAEVIAGCSLTDAHFGSDVFHAAAMHQHRQHL